MPSKDPLYYIWWGMMRRCHRPNPSEARKYRDRGIYVCEEWKVFANFRRDMFPRPPGTGLERKNNDGPYAPWNVRWATPMENSANTRQNKPITMFGKTQHQNQWVRELGINQTTIRKVLKRHADPETAIRNHLERCDLARRNSEA
jgi:hypothetical protein